jgi:hypothetical protein
MPSTPYWKTKQNSINLDAGPKNNLFTIIITRLGANPSVFIPAKLPYTIVALGLLQTPFTNAIAAYAENPSLENENTLLDQVAIINAVFYELYDFVDGAAGGSKTVINLAGLDAYKHVSTSQGKPLASLNCKFGFIKDVVQMLLFSQRKKPTTAGTLLISTTIPGGLNLVKLGNAQMGIITPLGIINVSVFSTNSAEVASTDSGKKLAGTSIPFNASGFGPSTNLDPTLIP